jgi:hypothetical protein
MKRMVQILSLPTTRHFQFAVSRFALLFLAFVPISLPAQNGAESLPSLYNSLVQEYPLLDFFRAEDFSILRQDSLSGTWTRIPDSALLALDNEQDRETEVDEIDEGGAPYSITVTERSLEITKTRYQWASGSTKILVGLVKSPADMVRLLVVATVSVPYGAICSEWHFFEFRNGSWSHTDSDLLRTPEISAFFPKRTNLDLIEEYGAVGLTLEFSDNPDQLQLHAFDCLLVDCKSGFLESEIYSPEEYAEICTTLEKLENTPMTYHWVKGKYKLQKTKH